MSSIFVSSGTLTFNRDLKPEEQEQFEKWQKKNDLWLFKSSNRILEFLSEYQHGDVLNDFNTFLAKFLEKSGIQIFGEVDYEDQRDWTQHCLEYDGHSVKDYTEEEMQLRSTDTKDLVSELARRFPHVKNANACLDELVKSLETKEAELSKRQEDPSLEKQVGEMMQFVRKTYDIADPWGEQDLSMTEFYYRAIKQGVEDKKQADEYAWVCTLYGYDIGWKNAQYIIRGFEYLNIPVLEGSWANNSSMLEGFALVLNLKRLKTIPHPDTIRFDFLEYQIVQKQWDFDEMRGIEICPDTLRFSDLYHTLKARRNMPVKKSKSKMVSFTVEIRIFNGGDPELPLPEHIWYLPEPEELEEQK